MASSDRDIDDLVDELSAYIKESLCRTTWEGWDGGDVPPAGLIFPRKRDGTRRISEQESRIAATQWLHDGKYPFSVETPTGEKFVMSGVTETGLSARTDITVFRVQGDDLRRLLNIEVKALQPKKEGIVGDLQKLLREQVEGMWFHTLVSADTASWRQIGRKLWWAYRDLSEDPCCLDAFRKPLHSVRFRFLDMRTSDMRKFTVRFSHWEDDLRVEFPLEEAYRYKDTKDDRPEK